MSINDYSTFSAMVNFPYECISALMVESELVWKLLKYDTSDAWNRPNLSSSEKRALIYSGQDDTSLFRVFMDEGQPDVLTKEMTVLRIANYSIMPDNRIVGTVNIIAEVYSHYKLNHLSNYTVRTDAIMGELIRVFNGRNVGGIGRLFFDKMGSPSTRLENGGQLPFKGKWMIMSNKSS